MRYWARETAFIPIMGKRRGFEGEGRRRRAGRDFSTDGQQDKRRGERWLEQLCVFLCLKKVKCSLGKVVSR